MKGWSGYQNSPAKQKFVVVDARSEEEKKKEQEQIKKQEEKKKKDQLKIQQQIEGTYVETEEDIKRRKEDARRNAPRKISPAKQKKGKNKKTTKNDTVIIDGKTYPKGYTKKDVKRLKEQREDIVRYEELDEAGKKLWHKVRGTKYTPSKKKK